MKIMYLLSFFKYFFKSSNKFWFLFFIHNILYSFNWLLSLIIISNIKWVFPHPDLPEIKTISLSAIFWSISFFSSSRYNNSLLIFTLPFFMLYSFIYSIGDKTCSVSTAIPKYSFAISGYSFLKRLAIISILYISSIILSDKHKSFNSLNCSIFKFEDV